MAYFLARDGPIKSEGPWNKAPPTLKSNKPTASAKAQHSQAPDPNPQGSQTFPIDRIIRCKVIRGVKYYQIKWTGHSKKPLGSLSQISVVAYEVSFIGTGQYQVEQRNVNLSFSSSSMSSYIPDTLEILYNGYLIDIVDQTFLQ